MRKPAPASAPEQPPSTALFATTELPCPACDTAIRVANANLLDGSDVRCTACGEAWVLTQERAEDGHGAYWALVEETSDEP